MRAWPMPGCSYAVDVADTRQRASAAPACHAGAPSSCDRRPRSEMRGWLAIESARLEQYNALGAMRRHAGRALAQFAPGPSAGPTSITRCRSPPAHATRVEKPKRARALARQALHSAERSEPGALACVGHVDRVDSQASATRASLAP